MASINEIKLDNEIIDGIKGQRQLVACDILIDKIYIGCLENYKKLKLDEEYYADLLSRSKDYLLHYDLFEHDTYTICNLVDERLYDKIILMTLKDLMILEDLEYIYIERLQKGDLRLRATIDKKPVIFDDKSKFSLTTEKYMRIRDDKRRGDRGI